MNRLANTQRGMTLIGLMIGMLLSVLAVLAAMTMYKNLVTVAIDTKTDAQHDGQLASAALTMQKELQNAGFGIPSAAAVDHLKTPTATTMYWRYQTEITSGVYNCQGIEYGVDANSGYSMLKLMKKEGCAFADALDGSSGWSVDGVLAVFKSEVPSISFSKSASSCFPFGRTTTSTNNTLVTINAESAASRANSVNAGNDVYQFCLPNLLG